MVFILVPVSRRSQVVCRWMRLVCAQLQWQVSSEMLENYYVGFMNTIYELMYPYEDGEGGVSEYTHELAAMTGAWMYNLTRNVRELPAEYRLTYPPPYFLWPEDNDRWALNPEYDPEFPYLFYGSPPCKVKLVE